MYWTTLYVTLFEQGLAVIDIKTILNHLIFLKFLTRLFVYPVLLGQLKKLMNKGFRIAIMIVLLPDVIYERPHSQVRTLAKLAVPISATHLQARAPYLLAIIATRFRLLRANNSKLWFLSVLYLSFELHFDNIQLNTEQKIKSYYLRM